MTPPTVLALPRYARVPRLAMSCRAAALDFVNRVSTTDDKATLAEWLRGTYRRVVIEVGPPRSTQLDARTLVPGALARLLARSRSEVTTALLSLREADEGATFGFAATRRGLVYRCVDSTGTEGWVPIAQPRMRLTDRVLSLVAADYLVRPGDYAARLFECVRCEVVAFDLAGAGTGVCRAHAQSDVRELREPGDAQDGEAIRSASC